VGHVAINLAQKLCLFHDLWSPRVVAELNDYQIKLAKLHGAFVWHQHDDTDELFYVLDGVLEIALDDGVVTVRPGELYVVPKGTRHRPFAAEPVSVLLIEPRGVVNTGGAGGALTAANDVWV
jgi:mannose-6-phosphate isomerase-like protein (cupin superfamily)